MKLAYTTTFDARDVHNWSGTPYHMSQALAESGAEVDYIGSLKRKLPRFFKMKQVWNKYVADQRESPRFNVFAAQHYSQQVAKKLLERHCDVVVSPLINPIAYLDCKQPIVLWTDALYAALLGFYPPFAHHSADTIRQGNAMTTACLSRCKLAVFSSDWAAHSALQLYGISQEKVTVIPYGANIDTYPSYHDIQNIIAKRASNKIKLLFLAKSWERKGGDVVLNVAHALFAAGYPVELTIVGYHPPNLVSTPYIHCLGFISKHTLEGKQKLTALLSETHFLFVPSRAEAYGIVFCEANAFGVPCLTTYVGGISTIVKNNVNGMTFGLDAPISAYCDYITQFTHDHARYSELALSAHHEYESRLNWKTATQQLKQMIETFI